MYVRIVTFRLEGVTTEEYEGLCDQIAPAFTHWPGLIAKVWLDGRLAGTFGGVYLFESEEAAQASQATSLFRDMVANPVFADLRIDEFPALDAPTAVTAGRITEVAAR